MFVARKAEQKILMDAASSKDSSFIAVYGRRRIGKTYLVRETFNRKILFSHTGVNRQNTAVQLTAFKSSLDDAGYHDMPKPSSWFEAFDSIKEIIMRSRAKKKIIFLDELSWMDTPRSDFMTALEFFWNGWANARKDVLLIVCASSTSWMLNKVIHNKGGLYNRLTDRIHLAPFTLGECEELNRSNGIIMNRHQCLMAYMILGGVPYYWNMLKKGLSLPQNIDELFFSENAPMKEEYQYLYASLFKNPAPYERIVQVLAQNKRGLTRNEVIAHAGFANSGTLTRQLEELEQCGFTRKFPEFGKSKKGAVYQLIDNFTLFYLTFMDNKHPDPNFWTNSINNPGINTWAGLAFERVCLEHLSQIKEALGIRNVVTTAHSFRCDNDPDRGISGSQIDLLIVRNDHIINICEMKYTSQLYSLNKSEEAKIRIRINDFQRTTGARSAIHSTLITPYGLKKNLYSDGIQSVITADDLFK